jgi:CBS domain-containing protein
MATTVREVMSGDPVCLNSQSTLYDAAEKMAQRDIGDVLVTEGEHLRGVVTDRDIVVRGLANHRDPENARLSEIISEHLVTIEPDESIDRAVELMREHAIRRLPVVEGDRPVGIVSMGDLAIERDPRSALADVSVAQPNR